MALLLGAWVGLRALAGHSAYFANLFGWLQDGSALTLVGGVRGTATRVTMLLVFVGAALATLESRHVSVDLFARALSGTRRDLTARATQLFAAVMCLLAAWAFFDFLAIDAFGAAPEASVLEKLGLGASAVGTALGALFSQLVVDVKTFFRVAAGEVWTVAPTMLEVPGVAQRGGLVKTFDLLIPGGFVALAGLFVGSAVKPGAPEAPAHAVLPRGAWVGGALFVAAAGATLGPLAGVTVLALLLGAPLFSVLLCAASLSFVDAGQALRLLAPKVLEEQFAGSPVLVTIPLFSLLGYVLANSQAPARLVAAARAALGWLPGGLALACLLASAFFTALTGGSGISIVAIGGLLLPALSEHKYPEKFSLGLVTTGGSLGLLFPPSLAILVYAFVAGIDFEVAFRAAFIPGLFVWGLLAAAVLAFALRAKMPTEPFVLRALGTTANHAKWELVLPAILFGSLALGVAGPDESAALGLLWAVVAGRWLNRDLKLRADLPRIAAEAIALAGAVVVLLLAAQSLVNAAVDHRWPQHVMDALTARGLTERWQFLIAMNLVLLVIGMVMDGLSALIVSVPLFLPLAAKFALSPFHLLVMMVLNLEIAFCLPPLGLNLFISAFRFNAPLPTLYRAVLPWVGVLLCALLGVMAMPRLSTWLVERDISDARAAAERLHLPPRDAWLLECVQEDVTNPRPCNDAERAAMSAVPPAEATDEDALFKEMMGATLDGGVQGPGP